MAYNGSVDTIPLGVGGLHTDDPQPLIPRTNLILARNVTLRQGLIEKEPGSRRYNQSSLGSPIRALYDWWPASFKQRLIAVTAAGAVYCIRQPNLLPGSPIVESVDGSEVLKPTKQTHIITGGEELEGRLKKLFILTGQDPIQVISSDNLTERREITGPAVDWDGTDQPSFMIPIRCRMLALGNRNNPHRIYISDDADHENFASNGAQYSVYPGEGERLFSAFTYKSRVFLLKYPSGAYYVDDTNPDPSAWGIYKVSDSFGAAAAHAALETLDDTLISNATGSVSSVASSQNFGDITAGNILMSLRNESYMRSTTSQAGNLDRWALYYDDRKQALFTYRGAGSLVNNRLLCIDISTGNARVTWSDKDQMSCLAKRKDITGIQRPMYGAEDGYIYLMEQVDRQVHTTAYRAEFQTPHLDFGDTGGMVVSEANKIFQHLEVVFEPTGRWNVYVEVWIDGIYSETIPFKVSWGPVLDDFLLDRGKLSGRIPRSIRKPLHGTGRRISLKVYNEGLKENFKLTALRVYWKPSGQQQRGAEK